jgi:hypothetical protein
MSDEIVDAAIYGAMFTNENLFVDLFNDVIRKDDFDFDFAISTTIKIGRYEFVKTISRLELTKEFKQELYSKGLVEAISNGNVKYMKECIRFLESSYKLDDTDIIDAIYQQHNYAIEYLMENNYYVNYKYAAVIAAESGNYKLLLWLLSNYNMSGFDLNMIRNKIKHNYENNYINVMSILKHN